MRTAATISFAVLAAAKCALCPASIAVDAKTVPLQYGFNRDAIQRACL